MMRRIKSPHAAFSPAAVRRIFHLHIGSKLTRYDTFTSISLHPPSLSYSTAPEASAFSRYYTTLFLDFG